MVADDLSREIGLRVGALGADADDPLFAVLALGADVHVVAARLVPGAGVVPQCDVVRAGPAPVESLSADAQVPVALVSLERLGPDGDVALAGHVVPQRLAADGRIGGCVYRIRHGDGADSQVAVAVDQLVQGPAAVSGIVYAGGQILERLIADPGIARATRHASQRPPTQVRIGPRAGVVLLDRRPAVDHGVSAVRQRRIRDSRPRRHERAGLALRPLRTLGADRAEGRIEHRARPVGPREGQQVGAGQNLGQPRHHA